MKILQNALRWSNDPFALFRIVEVAQTPDKLSPDGVLLLHGGEDISPSIYGEDPIDQCHADRQPSPRDLQEMELLQQAVKMGIPIIGICRGAQLLCAMDGGKLWQHSTGHQGGNHAIFDTTDGEGYVTNSAHHQIMRPLVHNLTLAVCNETVDVWDESGKPQKIERTPEIVFFPHLNAIGIQGHPEWNPNARFVSYCARLIETFLLNK